MNPQPARREIAMRSALVIFVLVLLAYLFMDYNNRVSQYNRVLGEYERVAGQKLVRVQTQNALLTQIAYATSELAVREYGYTNHQYQEGDIPVVVVNPILSTPTPIPQPVTTVVETSNFQRWLSLFIPPSENTLP